MPIYHIWLVSQSRLLSGLTPVVGPQAPAPVCPHLPFLQTHMHAALDRAKGAPSCCNRGCAPLYNSEHHQQHTTVHLVPPRWSRPALMGTTTPGCGHLGATSLGQGRLHAPRECVRCSAAQQLRGIGWGAWKPAACCMPCHMDTVLNAPGLMAPC